MWYSCLDVYGSTCSTNQPPTPPTHASVQAMKIITHWILNLAQLKDKFLEALPEAVLQGRVDYIRKQVQNYFWDFSLEANESKQVLAVEFEK